MDRLQNTRRLMLLKGSSKKLSCQKKTVEVFASKITRVYVTGSVEHNVHNDTRIRMSDLHPPTSKHTHTHTHTHVHTHSTHTHTQEKGPLRAGIDFSE